MKFKKIYAQLLLLLFVFVTQHAFAQVTDATMQQIQAILKEKNSRTPVQQKIDSRLLQAVRENRNEKMVAGIDLLPANVDADASGVLKVDINGNITNELLSKITTLVGTIIYPSAKYHTVRATINLRSVEKIAAYPEVTFIQPAAKSIVVDANKNAAMLSPEAKKRVEKFKTQLQSYLHPLSGSVTSEGDATHRANEVRNTFGYQGQGVKIGVLSDSYNSLGKASADVANGDLPGSGNPEGDTIPVTVLNDGHGTDEGRAMLQVIHDLAPKAQLFFAVGTLSEAFCASNIEALRNTYHCDIICDDVFFLDEPVFQDGIIAQAVDDVTASGALYFSAAGNFNSLAKNRSGVYEGDFNDEGSPPFTGSTKNGTIHNFGSIVTPVNGNIIKGLSQYSVYSLNWSDASGASANDYDLFLINASGKVKASSTNIQTGHGNPFESLNALATQSSDRLVVFKTSGAAVRAFHIATYGGVLTVATNGATFGHACAPDAFCVAATPAGTAYGQTGSPTGPYPNPFVSTNKVEIFSADGPRKMFYSRDSTAITPGKFTFASNGGITFAKPDFTAADGVVTTFEKFKGLNPFFGTSCAAPHASAIAALLLSGNHSLTAAQVRSILTSTALDIESAGYDNVSGYGIIQAFQAADAVATICNTKYDGAIHNTFENAVTIPLNTGIDGTISSSTDNDFYRFTIATKGAGSITLTNLPADYDMYIYNNAQKLVTSSKKRGTKPETLSGNLPKGNFYIKIVGYNGAFDNTSCYTLTVSQSSGLRAENDNSDRMSIAENYFQLYPNPASSMLNVKMPKLSTGAAIRITDVYGKTLITKAVASTDVHINVSTLHNGLYILDVVDKNGVVINTSKFEKQ